MTRPSAGHNPLLGADQPLSDPGEDALGYASFAKMLAQSALRGSPATGLVVGVYGEWGLGKTTLLNFIQHYAETDADDEAPIVIRFNPWWFSGREDLLGRFFSEFEQAVLTKRGKRSKLRKAIGKLGEAAANIPSAWATGVGKTAMLVAAHGQPADLKSLKEDIVQALKAEPLRVIVLVDDIDRLLPSEMVDIFRMVRSVGDLPNVHYVLAFDRNVVAKALYDATGTDGETYLEKIIQAPFSLPRPTAISLREIFEARIQEVLAGTDIALFDARYWNEVIFHGVFPFLQTPRDIVRIINVLAVIYPSVQNDVNPADFVAIETLRVFAPVAYEIVRANQTRFVGLLSAVEHMRADNKRFHEQWLATTGSNAPAVIAIIRCLFPSVAKALGSTQSAPADGDFRKRRRICTDEVFEHYFRYVPGRGVSRREFIECINADDETQSRRLRSFLTERVDGRKTKLRQFLEMLHDELGADLQPRPALLEQICAVGDLLIAAMPTDFAFEAPDDIFLVFTVERFLGRLSETERMAVLRKAITGAGVSITARIATILGAQHGRRGEQSSEPSERTLPSASDIEELEQLALDRIQQSAENGSLWAAPGLVRLLFDWKGLGGTNQMRAAVRRWTAGNVANMVALVEGLGSPSTSGHVLFELNSVSDVVDLDDAAAAVSVALSAQGLEPRQRAALVSFMQTYSATESTRREQILRKKVLACILEETVKSGWFPTIDHVNVVLEHERARVQTLNEEGMLRVVAEGRYLVTFKGLRELGDDVQALEELEARAFLIERLQDAYRASARAPVALSDISQGLTPIANRPPIDRLQRATMVLICEGDSSQSVLVEHDATGPKRIAPLPGILDVASAKGVSPP